MAAERAPLPFETSLPGALTPIASGCRGAPEAMERRAVRATSYPIVNACLRVQVLQPPDAGDSRVTEPPDEQPAVMPDS
jgi:hypothetical protein